VRQAPGLALRERLGDRVSSFVARVLAAAWQQEARSLRLSVYFCADGPMRELHWRFLGDDSATDVLSFPLAGGVSAEQAADGELVVCVDFAVAAAAKYGNTVAAELALYLAHGALHLLGYDDHDRNAARRMRRAEKRVLDALGLSVKGRHDR
jgi:probable rRNA maturation factor